MHFIGFKPTMESNREQTMDFVKSEDDSFLQLRYIVISADRKIHTEVTVVKSQDHSFL